MILYSFRPPSADYLGFSATVEGISAAAALAEELGFDAIVLNDHILVDSSPRAAPWTNTFDPLVTLGYLAARTRRIRLGTSVLIMPYRNPMATAKMLATLDQLSGGRVIAGVGVGWAEAEFAALGVPFHERGVRTSEYLAIWQACWAEGPATFHGRFFSFDAMHIRPKPVQKPHPPIWIGGSSDGALRRAARFAQVWQPMQTTPEALRERQAFLRVACAELGRPDVPTIRMSVRVAFPSAAAGSAERPPGQGTPAQVAEDLRRYRGECGVEAFQINFTGCADLAQLLDWMKRFMGDVAPRVER